MKWPTLVLVVLALAGLGGLAWTRGENAHAPPAAPSSPAPLASNDDASGAAPTAPENERRALLGVVVPRHEVYLAAAELARIDRVAVGVGDRVEAGAPIVELDTRRSESELQSVQASTRAARAEVERWRIETQRSADALRRAERIEGFLADEELTDLRYAQGSAAAGQRRAGAGVQEQRARIAQLTERIHDAVIRSPFAGVVVQAFAEPGAVVTAGEPIVHMISEERLVRFAADEAQARAMEIGAPLVIMFDDLDLVVHAAITKVVPEVDSAARIVIGETSLDLDEPAATKIRVGAMARVYFATARPE